MNHVIEHVANPILVIAGLFRVVKKGAYVVISAPDKTCTFDRTRNLTTFDHLYDQYLNQVKLVADDHYHDFVENCITHID
jgi:ubiquinone/menaquinone biosynthesis C-methylase UbiE